MTKYDILLLLKDILQNSSYATYDPDDISGHNPHWHFDQEHALRYIDNLLLEESRI